MGRVDLKTEAGIGLKDIRGNTEILGLVGVKNMAAVSGGEPVGGDVPAMPVAGVGQGNAGKAYVRNKVNVPLSKFY